MSQNWLSSNLWPKTTNVASVASNGLSDIKSGKTDANGTFQSLLAGKLSDKIQSSSMASKLNNNLGEMRASKKLDPPAIKGNPKSLDQVESRPKSANSVQTKEVENSSVPTTKKFEEKVTDTDVQANEKTDEQISVEEPVTETKKVVEEIVEALNAIAQYLIEEAPKNPELEQKITELVAKLESLTAAIVQNGRPEVLLKEIKSVQEAAKTLQSLGSLTQKALPAEVKSIVDQLSKTLEKIQLQSVQPESFEAVLKDLNALLKENVKASAPITEAPKEIKHNPTTSSASAESETIKPLVGDLKDQKNFGNGQGNDTEGNKQKFSDVVKLNQESKQSPEAKTSNHNFVSEMNAKVESSSIAFGKTETAIGKTSLQQNILDQIINSPRMQVKQTELGTIMTMKLNPEVLGNVEIKLEIIKNVLQAEINVENMIVKGAIESNLSDLKNALSDKGYQVENLNVSVNKDGQEQRGQQQRQNEQAQRYLMEDEETPVSKSFKLTSLNEDGTIDYLG